MLLTFLMICAFVVLIRAIREHENLAQGVLEKTVVLLKVVFGVFTLASVVRAIFCTLTLFVNDQNAT